jgi:hypothetical protein
LLVVCFFKERITMQSSHETKSFDAQVYQEVAKQRHTMLPLESRSPQARTRVCVCCREVAKQTEQIAEGLICRRIGVPKDCVAEIVTASRSFDVPTRIGRGSVRVGHATDFGRSCWMSSLSCSCPSVRQHKK